MNAGVPVVVWRPGHQRVLHRPVAGRHETEVEHLHEVVLEAHPADVDIGRRDVAVDEPACVRFRERMTDLTEQEERALGGHRTEFANERRRDPVPASSSIT